MGYQFTFEKMQVKQVENAREYQAILDVTKNGNPLGKVIPARSQYPTKAELLHEVGLLGGFWQDVYVTISDFERKTMKSATFELHVNPTVRVVWIAVFIMVLGGFITIFDKYRGNKNRDVMRSADAV
jgi:cytochrome c-type biogenesis protein CcmF